MSYKKPVVLAQNQPAGSFAGGCPSKSTGGGWCKECDRAQ